MTFTEFRRNSLYMSWSVGEQIDTTVGNQTIWQS